MRLLQAMRGSAHGGAENFFQRLAPQLEQHLSQEILVRDQEGRLEELRQKGLVVKSCAFGGCFDIKSRFQFFQHIRTFAPQIVLTWMNRATSLCPSSKIFRKFLPPFIHVGRLGGYYNLKYYKNCDALIGNTKGIVEYLLREGWPLEKVFYVPNFAQPLDISLRPARKEDYATPQDAPVILALGRLHSNKAFDTLLRALVPLKDAYVWILGEGPEDIFLKDLAQKLGVSSRVRFLGWKENVGAFYKACTVFVCPSRHEPLGNVILEAWAHEVPVIAAASQGPQELIEHGKTGLLYSIDKAQELSSLLEKVLEDKEFRTILAQEGHREGAQKFSKEKVVEQYIACFETLLSQRKRS